MPRSNLRSDLQISIVSRSRHACRAMKKNPVRDLKISPAEKARLLHAVNREFGGQGAELRKGAALYTKFTGHEDVDVVKATIRPMPKVAVEIGMVDGILYIPSAMVSQKNIFTSLKANPGPYLRCLQTETVVFARGAFTFGERGIVDD